MSFLKTCSIFKNIVAVNVSMQYAFHQPMFSFTVCFAPRRTMQLNYIIKWLEYIPFIAVVPDPVSVQKFLSYG